MLFFTGTRLYKIFCLKWFLLQLENSESKSSEIAALTSKINHMLTKEQTYCQNIDEAALMLADKEKDITEQKQIADELNQLIEQQKGKLLVCENCGAYFFVT